MNGTHHVPPVASERQAWTVWECLLVLYEKDQMPESVEIYNRSRFSGGASGRGISMYRKKDFMILLEISDIKMAMVHLLVRDSFDTFYLDSAEITTYATMSLRGRRNAAWYDSDQQREESVLSEWIRWSEAKFTIFSYIKGNKTPDTMKIILKADSDWLKPMLIQSGLEELYLQQRPDFILNLRYEKDSLSVITGVSQPEFTMDKQLEFAWDDMLPYYFKHLGIALF